SSLSLLSFPSFELPADDLFELIPRLENEARVAGRFNGVEPVEEIRPRGPARSAPPRRVARKGVALGEKRGEQGGFARAAGAVPFYQQAGETGVDREAGQRPP